MANKSEDQLYCDLNHWISRALADGANEMLFKIKESFRLEMDLRRSPVPLKAG